MTATQAHDRPGRLADDGVPDARTREPSTAARTSRRSARARPVAARARPGETTATARRRPERRRGAADASPRERSRGRLAEPTADDAAGRPAELPQRRGDLAGDSTRSHGGFGRAPKFPPSMALSSCCGTRAHRRRRGRGMARADARGDGARRDLRPARRRVPPLLGRRPWLVPHFEKMLYDNALLARVYAHLWRPTGRCWPAGGARRPATGWSRTGTPQGGLAASLDADSEGEEGKFYVWTPGELAAVLGPERAPTAATCSRSPRWPRSSRAVRAAARPRRSTRTGSPRSGPVVTAREQRPRPGRDDKVVAAWNGLAVAALAETGLLLDAGDLIGRPRPPPSCWPGPPVGMAGCPQFPGRHRGRQRGRAGRLRRVADGFLASPG